jgi:hypothetical protein
MESGGLMLPGIALRHLKRFPKDWESFAEVIRMDWTDAVQVELVQANLPVSYHARVSAWHRREMGQIGRFLVIKGSLEICPCDDGSGEIAAHGEELQIVKVPSPTGADSRRWANRCLSSPTSRTGFMTTTDRTRSGGRGTTPLLPISSNGSLKDLSGGKPWDWFNPSFK